MTEAVLRSCLGFAAAALVVAGLQGPAAAQGGGPNGRWLTQDRDGVIEIDACGRSLCGRIIALFRDRPGSAVPTDIHGRPLCGLQILEMNTGQGKWSGSITDPRDGSTWQAEMRIGDDGHLHLRGYLGIPLLGRTQIWTRYAGRILENCRPG
jgi:uncharacterized protein (DUF2147 family)